MLRVQPIMERWQAVHYSYHDQCVNCKHWLLRDGYSSSDSASHVCCTFSSSNKLKSERAAVEFSLARILSLQVQGFAGRKSSRIAECPRILMWFLNHESIHQGWRNRGSEGAWATPEHSTAPYHWQKHPFKIKEKLNKTLPQADIQQVTAMVALIINHIRFIAG